MGKQRPTPSMRKNVQRKHVMELLRVTARPPQERWSIRESVNFKIALGRFGEDWPRIAQFVSTKTTHQALPPTFSTLYFHPSSVLKPCLESLRPAPLRGAGLEQLCENELQPAPLPERSRGSGVEPNRHLMVLSKHQLIEQICPLQLETSSVI
ncbi:uncharacterized protein LOC125508972 [Triticum urartu]|uniref:uncharacterized protein LOC125508972 n=1 Tax=Triticum urartu TaxID=4572 RepID=UPI0020433BAB|nr:uncharacterized protein LOC125508972 [Triticum urartu]